MTAMSPSDLLRLLEDDPRVVAPGLLGATLTVTSPEGAVGVRLSEVEAYCGEADPGSHAFRGRTARNASMFEAAGTVYVYFTYGMHYCVNIVCGRPGVSRAVLLRAGEVVEGLDLARGRRPAARKDRDLARGPARLAAALGLDREDDGSRSRPCALRSEGRRRRPRGRWTGFPMAVLDRRRPDRLRLPARQEARAARGRVTPLKRRHHGVGCR